MHRLVSGASRIDRCISYCLKGLCFIDPGYFYTVYLETHTQSHTHTHFTVAKTNTHDNMALTQVSIQEAEYTSTAWRKEEN